MSKQLTGTWRKQYDFRFISGEDITKEVTLTIKAVTKETVHGQDEPVNALHFVETPKMMAVNKTNAKTISRVVGSPLLEQWVSKKIILISKDVKAFGSVHRAIRVKMQKV